MLRPSPDLFRWPKMLPPRSPWTGDHPGSVANVAPPAGTDGIDLDAVPTHIACVMDGNGRWAQQQGLPRTEGHRAGELSLFDAIEGALELGVGWFTVYAFSTENWRRPTEEVRFLLNFNRDVIRRRRDELHERGVRIRTIGRGKTWRVPRGVQKEFDDACELTKGNTRLQFTIAFNYGGRAEIVDAVRALMADGVKPDRISEKSIAARLYDPKMPDPDLVIRTSGENRLSNFLVWQLAYSELLFMDVLWPDFRREHLYDAVREYQQRNRRFGGV